MKTCGWQNPGRLRWSLRRIEQAAGIRRETADYLRAARITVRSPRGWEQPRAKPLNEVITGPGLAKSAKPVMPQ